MRSRSDPQRLQLRPKLLNRYVVIAVMISVALLTGAIIAGLPIEPFTLAMVLGPLLGGAIFTARRSGPGAVRALFTGLLHWRIGWRNWALAVVVMPATTVAPGLAAKGCRSRQHRPVRSPGKARTQIAAPT